MARIAKVVVGISADRSFDYVIPRELVASLSVGSKVIVPFGRSTRDGYVVGLADTSERSGLKKIASLVSKTPLISAGMLKLARWMADYYAAPMDHAIRALLPGPVRGAAARPVERLFVEASEAAMNVKAVDQALRRAPKQGAVLAMLQSSGGMFVADLIRNCKTSVSVVRSLEKKGLVSVQKKIELRSPGTGQEILQTHAFTLMPEQKSAVDLALRSVQTLDPGVILLFGVTGSGKTEVYLQVIAEVLSQGKGAIVLVPEISLTPQAVERFRGRFGDHIAVLHSHLSAGERHDEWHRIHGGDAQIAIGARSAIFAPVSNLGLIVVDEEHDTSYKQEESPKYNARDIAVMRGKIEKCSVMLGSATPSMESYSNVQSGKYGIATLSHRVDHRKMPAMRIVDMRVETERQKRVNIFSTELVEAIRSRLDRAEQTILFLNRRGYATSLVCPRCGHVQQCDLCSVSLTYHKQSDRLRCHICGSSRSTPTKCPKCGDRAFKFAGVGTQRIESTVEKLFPAARVRRMDSDTTTRKNSHRDILDEFRTGKTDILIGTQMIAKGLDFPNVTLIGIVYADLSLHMADFRAGERTFQLLTQVAGRAGRGDVPGEVIVQTYTPFHIAVQAARQLDYLRFYDQESEFRKELSYPPFSRLICVTVKGRVERRVSFAAEAFAKSLRCDLPRGVILSDSAPAPLAKAKGRYRYQVMMRSRSARTMVSHVRNVLAEFSWPPEVSCSVDVDAISLL